jgi:hypothetical protein
MPNRLNLVFFLFVLVCNAAYYEGALKTSAKWHYLGKFCVSNQFERKGILRYKIEANLTKTAKMMLYLDTENKTEGAWEPVYSGKDTLDCQQLVDMNNGITTIVSGVEHEFTIEDDYRAYFWFMAVADCDSKDGLDITYRLWFSNPGNIWYQQFSYDEQGVCQYYIFFTLLFLTLLTIHLVGVFQLIKMESWHPIIRVLTTALTSQFLACLCEMIHYLIYLTDGVGSPDLKALGDLLAMITQIVIMFLCILVAKGWAITTSYLSDKNILIVATSLLLLSYLALFISDHAATDPASTLYFYDSVPGLIVILLRIGVTAWFLWCLRATVGFETLPEKRKFYTLFGFCYTVWFLLLPGIVALAYALPEWVRFKTVGGLSLSADALAFIVFVVILSPSRAVSFFNIKSTPQLLSEHDKPGYGTAKAFTEDL